MGRGPCVLAYNFRGVPHECHFPKMWIMGKSSTLFNFLKGFLENQLFLKSTAKLLDFPYDCNTILKEMQFRTFCSKVGRSVGLGAAGASPSTCGRCIRCGRWQQPRDEVASSARCISIEGWAVGTRNSQAIQAKAKPCKQRSCKP